MGRRSRAGTSASLSATQQLRTVDSESRSMGATRPARVLHLCSSPAAGACSYCGCGAWDAEVAQRRETPELRYLGGLQRDSGNGLGETRTRNQRLKRALLYH